MSADSEDMSWESSEIDRSFDFMNVMFGALISAFLGVEFSKISMSNIDAIYVVAIIAMLGFLFFNLRSLCSEIVQSLETRMSTTFKIVSICSAFLSVWLFIKQLPVNRSVFLIFCIGWLLSVVVISLGMVLRRWIKFYD